MLDLHLRKNRSTIVRNLSLSSLVHNELVHSAWTESARQRLRDRKACRDIREELRLSLRGVRALLEEDDGRLLQKRQSQHVRRTCMLHTMGNPRCILEGETGGNGERAKLQTDLC